MNVFKKKIRHRFLSIAGTYLLMLLSLFGCKTEASEKIHKPPTSSFSEPQFTKEGELGFFRKNTTEIIRIDIEIPDTPEEKRRGLMYRKTMAETEGMFFVNEINKSRFFWMKNTYIPLDMIFVDKKMQIIKIEKNTAPLSEKLITVPKEAQYIVEVNAGFCDRHGIRTGDSIRVF